MIIDALLSGKTLFCGWVCRETHVLTYTQAFTNILDLTEKVTEPNNIVLLTEKEEPYFNSNSFALCTSSVNILQRLMFIQLAFIP